MRNFDFLKDGKGRFLFCNYSAAFLEKRTKILAFAQFLTSEMHLGLVYPCTSALPPMLSDRRKAPRLHLLDTGFTNFVAGLQKDLLNMEDLQQVYQGKIAEQIVGQELPGIKFNVMNELHFWVREKVDSSAEVDFVSIFDGKIIPVEVKSGDTGRLRSLHAFMDQAPHTIAVRLYAGRLKLNEVTTPSGKKYTLLNLPYYLSGQLYAYLDWLTNSLSIK